MKKNTLSGLLGLTTILVLTSSLFGQPGISDPQGFKLLTLQIAADRREYIVGEPMVLSVSVINETARTVEIFNTLQLDVKNTGGHLSIFIARVGESYKAYQGPWPVIDAVYAKVKLSPGFALREDITLLYTGGYSDLKSDFKHLNELYAEPLRREAQEKRFRRGFAFSEAGTYRIKAWFHGHGSKAEIESEPIEVQVSEPQNPDDVAIWNVLKTDPAFAYFMQTGGSGEVHTSAKTKQIVKALESLVESYPASGYGEHIRSGLSKHYTSVENLRKAGLLKDP